MFLRKGFNGKFIICAMIASLLSVHVAYAADPVDAIEINESGNCVAENVENAKYVHWDSGTNTCIVDTCADEYTLHENKCIKACDREVLAAKYATDGYLQEDKCIITVCADGYDLDTQNNLCKSRESGGGSGATVTADCGKNLFNPQLMTEGGFTYTSSNYLFKGKFSRAYNALNHTYSGDFLSNYYMSKYSYGLQKDTKYKLTYQIKCDENDIGNMYIGMLLKNGGTEAKEIPNNVCSGNTGLQTVTLRGGGNGTDVIGVFLGRLGDTDYTGDVEISNVMLVLDDEDTSRMIPYGPCIKISTKMATATRATGVEERLSNVRSIISDLITRTQDNADGINGLQSSKQTRPADANACPSNKTCLLVKDTAGHNNWYEIMTCGSDSFLNGITSVEHLLSLGNNQSAYGWKDSNGGAEALCEVSGVNCQNGEWATSYDSGIIYGQAKAVPIAERTYGQIVSLPSNAPTGNVCLCKVTGYMERTVNGQTVTYGTRKSVTTNKWTVTWAHGNTDDACLTACADDAEFPDNGVNGPKGGYYSNISNTCSSAAPSATMCQYNRYLDLIVANAPDSGNVGFETPLGSGNQGYDQICDHSPDTIDNTWCNTANDMSGGAPTWEHNTWIAKLPAITLSGTGEPNVPEIYGRAYCTHKDTTSLNQYDVLSQSEIGTVEPTGVDTGNIGDMACMCKVTGYRNAGAAQKIDVNSSKYLFVGDAQGKCNYDCQKMCADAFAQDADNNLMHQLADSCVAN